MDSGKEREYDEDDIEAVCEHRNNNPQTILTPTIKPQMRSPSLRETKMTPVKNFIPPIINNKKEDLDYKKYMIDSVVSTGNIDLIMQMFNKL